MGYLAMVTAANGQPVKMRSSPNTKNEKNVIKKLPVDTVVEVVEEGTNDGVAWSTIVADGVRGYMMSKFLKAEQPETPSEDEETPIPTDAYAEIMAKLEEILEAIAALGGVG